MTITVELDPATEARLGQEAEARGLAVEEYASSLLRNSLSTYAIGTGKLTIESLHTMIGEMAKGSENLPKLPTSAFSRESLYENHL